MQNKPYFHYVFVVLVYRNIDVLRDFFASLKLGNCHVVVVNSYYDDDSLKLCQEVAIKNSADFIPIENKGFGYGNNIGTKFVLDNYNYDFLILSNSDIHINNINALDKVDIDNVVVAPYTHLLGGKVQNPNIPWRIKGLFKLLKRGYDMNSRLYLSVPHLLTRISRELFKIYCLVVKKDFYKIYSCHGSFIIFSFKAVKSLYPLFDERMFLYNEELYLAERCRQDNIPILYCPKIDILHIEGASTGSGKGREHNRQSYDILYQWMSENDLL